MLDYALMSVPVADGPAAPPPADTPLVAPSDRTAAARAFWWWLALWLAVGCAARLAHLPAQPYPGNDEAYYLQIAERFARGDGLTSQYLFTLADPHPLPTDKIWKPPGYPLLLGLWAKACGPGFRAAQVSSVVLGVGLVLALALLARCFAGDRAAVAAAAAAAVHPRLVEFSAVPLADMLFVLCVVTGLLGVTRAKRGDGQWWAHLAGAAWGIGLAAKSVTAVPFAVGLAYAAWPTSRTGRRPDLRTTLAVGVGAAPFVLALLAFNLHVYGDPGGGAQGIVNLAQEWIPREELYFTPDMVDAARRTMQAVPLRVRAAQGAYNLWDYLMLTPPAFQPLALVLALGGLCVALRRRRERALPVLATALAFYAVCPVRAYPEGRYLLPVVALGCLWIGVLADRAVARVPAKYLPPVLAAAAVALAALLRVGNAWQTDLPPDPSLARAAAIVARDHTGARPPVIMERNRQVSYAAGAYNVSLPVGGPEVVAAVARRWHADYLIFDERVIVFRRPELMPWFDDPPDWLLRVGEAHQGPWRIRVFRVEQARL